MTKIARLADGRELPFPDDMPDEEMHGRVREHMAGEMQRSEDMAMKGQHNKLMMSHSSHFVEHLTGAERVHFFNELHRVLMKGGKATIIVPHWSNDCAYGDPTHQWPPVSNWTFLYLNKEWRDQNAPHVGYTCDFDWTFGFGLDPAVVARNQEFQHFAINHYRNAARELQGVLTKRA